MPGEVTQLLFRWGQGDESALKELMPIVYEELRRLARTGLRRHARESVLQPTALVNEAWLRFVRKRPLSLECRAQFYGLAAKVMRDILVDQSRRRRAAKRGGSQIEVALEDVNISEAPVPVDFLALDEAMGRLGAIKSRYRQIVEMRCLAGLTIDETAEALRLSHATIEREWNFARAWLRRELQRGPV